MSGYQTTNSVEDIAYILRTKYAIFTGGHDREFRSLITFQDVGVDIISDEAVSMLMQYFSTLAPCLASNRKYAALIDRRGSSWMSVRSVLKYLTTANIIIDHVYILKPQGFLQNLWVVNKVNKIRDDFHFCTSFADTVKELSYFIDPEHLPSETGGLMVFDIENWIRDRSNIEAFRNRVQLLCQREEELRLGFGKQSPSLVASCNDSPLLVLNASYLPPLYDQSKRLRRQWLAAVDNCEATGLQLRRNLMTSESSRGASASRRDLGSNPDETLPSGVANGTTADDPLSRPTDVTGSTFELPVDRIFHNINLTHLLLNLTEARTRFNQHWRQVIKRAKTARKLLEVESQFHKLREFSDLCGNLLESAADYQSVGKHQDDTQSGSSEFASPAGLEGLEAVVSRLVEAEQLANKLVPDLERLAGTTDWLIAYIPQCNRGARARELDSEDSAVSSARRSSPPTPVRPLIPGASSDSDSNDPPTLSSGSADSSAFITSLPALHLPTEAATEWPLLFNRLIDLARFELPRAVDQLNLLVQLHAEINSARTWCSRGRSLVNALHHSSSREQESDSLKSLSLSECQTRLAELNAFHASKEATLELLADPRLFHLKFSSITNTDLRSLLKDLLCSVDEVENSCQTKAAELRQQISRLSFPRQRLHTSSSFSPPSSTCMAPFPVPVSSTGAVEGEAKAVAGALSKSASLLEQVTTSPGAEASNAEAQSSPAVISPARRFQLAWEELVDTERSYVNFLHHVHRVIWPATAGKEAAMASADDPPGPAVSPGPPPPPFMRDRPSWLLVNWPDLVTFHRDFLLPTLEACSGNGMKLKQWALQVAPRLTDLYSVYCSLHDSAVQVASYLEKDRVHSSWLSFCNEEVHKREAQAPLFPTLSQSVTPNCHTAGVARPALQLSSRLVTPVQRFQRYHLLLKRLVEMALTESSRNDLTEAHKTMLEMCEIVNLAMRFYGLSIRPSELGRLLLRADFSVSRSDTKAMTNQPCHVFLFTNTLLLTKFRLPHSSASPVLRLLNAEVGGGGGSPVGSGDLSVLNATPGRSHSNQSLPSLPLHPSNLIALAKSHVIGSSGGGSNSSLMGGGVSSNDSRSVYEIKEELPLAQIGLTPSVRADRRRFAIWTANRAQTYVFQSSDPSLREKWVRSINDLLMGQLRRLRDEALRRYLPQAAQPSTGGGGGGGGGGGVGVAPTSSTSTGLTPTRIGCITGVTPIAALTSRGASVNARSSSLPISSNTLIHRAPSDNDSILSLPLEQRREDS